DTHRGADAVVAQVLAPVELAGIVRPPRRLEPAEELDLVADVKLRQWPLDREMRLARGRGPAAVGLDLAYLEHRARRVRPHVRRGGSGAPGANGRGPSAGPAPPPHDPRLLTGIVANAVARENVPLLIMMQRGERPDPPPERDRREPVPTPQQR